MLEAQRFGAVAEGGVDAAGVGQGFGVGEADDGPAQRLDRLLAVVIVQHDIVALMHPAVDLDDQPQRHAGEIHHMSADRMLATHLPAVDGAALQPRPYPLLGQPADLALPREGGVRRLVVMRGSS
jgi:hypothetical protein